MEQQKLITIIVTGCNKGIELQWPAEIQNQHQNQRKNQKNNFLKQQGNCIHLNWILLKKVFIVASHITIESINNFLKQFSEKFSKVDILLNNAAVAVHGDGFDEKIAAYTIATNFFATMTPLITKNGKIIIVGSSAGKLTRVKKDSLLEQLVSEDLTIEKLKQFANQFIEGAKSMEYEKLGWPRSCYSVSKILINQFARVYSKEQIVKDNGIQVYTLCPGWVDTDMTSHKGPLTIQQGAETPVFLVELPFEVKPEYQGKFFEKKKVSSLI